MTQPVRHPPSTILQFLERLGARFWIDGHGIVGELYPPELAGIVSYVREALPVIKAELERRRALSKRSKPGERGPPAEVPPAGPRLNQIRVTNFFRGMNQVEIFHGQAEWIEVCWVKRQRDGRKVAAQQIAKLTGPCSTGEP